MVKTDFVKVLNQHAEIFASISAHEIRMLIAKLLVHHERGKVIGLGAGRMGYSLQAFIMRLSHIGYQAFMIGDTTLPRLSKNDLVLINSSSGNTPSMELYAKQAKAAGAYIVLLTAQRESKLAQIADFVLAYDVINNTQLMKTVYEQFSFLFLDHVAHLLVSEGNMTIEEIEYNHSILE